MNDKQKLYCAVSGYESKECWTSARDEYYYDLASDDAKELETMRINQLQAYASNVLDLSMSMSDLRDVNVALQTETCGTDDEYRVFESLCA